MELRQLRYFQVVAEELHFGRAAQRLHISQPPLSVQIRRLEAELGVTLLHRSTRHVELTAAGAELASRLAAVLPELDACFVDLQDVQAGLRGRLTVGFVSSANYTLLPAVAQRFRELRPHVTLRLQPLTSAQQIDALFDGTIDLGILRDVQPTATLHTVDVLTEWLVACVPSSHPLAARDEVGAADLVALPMVGFPHSLMPGYVERIREFFGAQVGDLRATQQVIHQETALSFVAAGGAFTILPASVAVLQPPTVTTVPLIGAPETTLSVVTVPERMTPAIEAFLACVDEVAQR